MMIIFKSLAIGSKKMAQIEQNINIRSHVGSDGILHLEVPVEMKDTFVVVTMRVRSLPTASEVTQSDGNRVVARVF